MARSKALLFEEEEQLSSRLCKAMAHPARVRMMGRLLRGRVVSYTTLVENIPLARATKMEHLQAIDKLGFLQPAALADGSIGYVLDRELYYRCTLATRNIVREAGSVVDLVVEEGREVG